VIPVFCVLVGLQALALAARSFLVLRGEPEMLAEAQTRQTEIAA
jgi:hypothetical protein